MSTRACPLRHNALRAPHTPAVFVAGRAYSFAEFDGLVTAAVRHLKQRNARKGDVVAFAGTPGLEYVAGLLGAVRAGAVACPINPKFPEEYRRRLLQRVDAVAVIDPVAESLSPAPITDDTPPSLDENQPATIIFTSGSAGEPKAALHSLGNHIHNAQLSNRNIPLAQGDRWLLSLPLFHVAGIGVVFRCLLGGAAVVIPDPGAELAVTIRDAGVTHVSLVATQLYRLLQTELGIRALRPLKAILLGGSGMPESLVREAHALGLRIHTSYGMTEMSSQVTTTRPCDPIEKVLTSGAPLDPAALRVSSEGEIQVRGRTLFLGYLRDGQVDRPMTSDGWFATGDLGQLDSDGYLRVTGRRDNMFVAGGENIQPEEIEAALCRCPNVLEAVVVPAAHPEFGAVPVAFVRCAGGTPDEDALRTALGASLPRFKTPKRFLPWPGDIAPAGIKPDRRAFAARAEQAARASGS